MDCDKIDLKILKELDNNARASILEIAKNVMVSKDSIIYRIKKLEKIGIIKFHITYTNFSKLGYTDYGIYTSIRKMSHSERKNLFEKILNNKNVAFCMEVGGKYDLFLGVIAKDSLEFISILDNINLSIKDMIIRQDIATRINFSHFTNTTLNNKDFYINKIDFGGKVENNMIDEIDYQILKIISNNAREKVIDISRKTNINPSTIQLRLKRMIESKIINGFFTYVDSNKLDLNSYIVTIKIKPISLEEEKKMFDYLSLNKKVSYYIKTFGPWNIEIGIEVKNNKELQEFMTNLRDKFSDQLLDTEIISVFETIKYDLFPL